jgi:hypothetical protein
MFGVEEWSDLSSYSECKFYCVLLQGFEKKIGVGPFWALDSFAV